MTHWAPRALLICCIPVAGLPAQTPDPARVGRFDAISRTIWEWAEVGYKETRSFALLRDELRAAGFEIRENIAGIPTAFTAAWGSGKPVIAILGEYDALPGLSQADVPRKQAVSAGAAGHGCGHNLLGSASALAAITVKEYLQRNKLAGTIRYYGTPAEEGGAGKVYMARAGVFQDVGIVLGWHPGSANASAGGSTLAILGAKFRFHGQSAHAAAAPDRGRSALDAVMVTAHAIELLREHVPQETRIHYVITEGGKAPNVVPDFAEVYLYARHPDMTVLDGIWERIEKCGRAGALATGTRVEISVDSSSYNVLPNGPLTALMDRALRSAGGFSYTPEERAFAEELRRSLIGSDLPPLESTQAILPPVTTPSPVSTDLGDVSWIVPTGQVMTATWVPGTPAHSWQAVACSGTTTGRKGMLLAAKAIALSAVEIYRNPSIVDEARSDFDRRRAGFVYRSRIPTDARPPLNYRDHP